MLKIHKKGYNNEVDVKFGLEKSIYNYLINLIDFNDDIKYVSIEKVDILCNSVDVDKYIEYKEDKNNTLYEISLYLHESNKEEIICSTTRLLELMKNMSKILEECSLIEIQKSKYKLLS